MATYSQLSQSKRGRDEYWNSGLALPDTKRTISTALAYDSDLMSLLDNIDDMDSNDNNTEGTDAINEFDGEIGFNAASKSIMVMAEIGLMARTHNGVESTDEKGSNDQMGSIKEKELTERNSEARSLVCDIKDFNDPDDVGAELRFLEDHICPHEFGIIINYMEGDSITNTMDYSDAGYGYADTREDFYGFLWEDDIWQLNEHVVIQNDFDRHSKKNMGLVEQSFMTFGTILNQCCVGAIMMEDCTVHIE